jgi:choline kinase
MTHAESIGIMKFSEDGAYKLRRALEEVVMAPAVLHRFFVDAIQHLADKGFVVNWADTGGLPWIDIDTPDDLEFAQANSHLFDATIALPAAIEGRP